MARVYEGKRCGLEPLCSWLERRIYRFAGICPEHEMDWKRYLTAMLVFNCLGILLVYILQRLQFYLPFNPQSFKGVSPQLSFNTAVSFVTNTNWQAYVGESAMSYLTQMMALTVQNFLSAATGMAILVAIIRGLVREESVTIGNFWVDLTRGVLYILLPLSLLLAVVLSSQGVIQNIRPNETIHLLQPNEGRALQPIPMGPVASEVAIKQLGTNGGGFFNANSAHPFENPTPVTNFFELLAILLIPTALCYTFGVMIKDKRQGWAIFFVMSLIFLPLAAFTMMAEQAGNPAFSQMGIEPHSQYHLYSAGNMEGKETRFGVINAAFWAAATTATSNGSVNAMLDSFTPLGGLIPLWFMHLGEVIFGGVGSGLYGMLMLVIITVFVSGLMVGRTPEFLGKKIGLFEMKMATLAVLIMPITVLFLTALATTALGAGSVNNPGAHGFTEILYAFTSMTNNNGSAFAGLHANTLFYNLAGGLAMLIGRFGIAIPVIAIAGSMVTKKRVPTSLGTLPTHHWLFMFLLATIIIILSALTFFPTLTLGPIVESVIFWSQYGH